MVPKGNTKNRGGRDTKCCKQEPKVAETFCLVKDNVSVNSKPDHPPPRHFFDGRIPHPRAKGKFKTPTLRAYKNELNPHPRAFSSIIHYKNMKNDTEIM